MKREIIGSILIIAWFGIGFAFFFNVWMALETEEKPERVRVAAKISETAGVGRVMPQEEPTAAERTIPQAETEEQYEEIALTATAYCPCMKCCGKTDGITATGTIATAGRTIAVDPTIIPYGTELEFNGIIYTAEDCGSAIKGYRIDVFFESHEEALEFGIQELTAYIK